MKTKLIKLRKYNIIVSDEKLTNGCYGITNLNYIVKYNSPSQGELKIDYKQGIKKIIASENPKHNLPSINYNGFGEELDIIDVEKICKELYPIDHEGFPTITLGNRLAFKRGFKTSQSLNKKQFTLEDIKKAFEAGINYQTKPYPLNKEFEEEYIKSLQQPKVFNIEIEMLSDSPYVPRSKTGWFEEGDDDRPKERDNKITITKVL